LTLIFAILGSLIVKACKHVGEIDRALFAIQKFSGAHRLAIRIAFQFHQKNFTPWAQN